MNTKRNILIAFLLNLIFSVFEFFGGIISGSSAILSDAVHDLGDALSIGVSFFLERKNKREADEKYTFGYTRYSILGSIITTLVLLIGSCLVVFGAVRRLIHPTVINYNEMILFAVIGVVVNLSAALITRKGNSLNQKAVNLHMLEDTFGWAIVLLGALVMRLTDITIIDPIISIVTTIFVLIHAIKNLKSSLEIMLEKCPENIDVNVLKKELTSLDGVNEIKSLRVWSLDEDNIFAVCHIVAENGIAQKKKIKDVLEKHGITHSTVELCAFDEDERLEHIIRNHTSHHHH